MSGMRRSMRKGMRRSLGRSYKESKEVLESRVKETERIDWEIGRNVKLREMNEGI